MSTAATPIPIAALAAYLAWLATQRTIELVVAARNTRGLLARGAREYGRGHYGWIVALHALFPLALIAEVWRGARPTPLWPLWLGLWLAAQALRFAALRTLGERWTTRILVLPGWPTIRDGPYRWLRHPNYLAVVIELAAAPLIFGAWRTALAFSLADLALLGVRIRCEEAALAAAEIEPRC